MSRAGVGAELIPLPLSSGSPPIRRTCPTEQLCFAGVPDFVCACSPFACLCSFWQPACLPQAWAPASQSETGMPARMAREPPGVPLPPLALKSLACSGLWVSLSFLRLCFPHLCRK